MKEEQQQGRQACLACGIVGREHVDSVEEVHVIVEVVVALYPSLCLFYQAMEVEDQKT